MIKESAGSHHVPHATSAAVPRTLGAPEESVSRGRLVLLVLLLTTFLISLQPVRSPDVWHHIASGRLVVEQGGPARTEVFSCTAQGKPWIQFEWQPP